MLSIADLQESLCLKIKKEYEPFSKHFLSKSRCNKIKQPVKDGEYIFAFYRCQNGYAPLYYRENE